MVAFTKDVQREENSTGFFTKNQSELERCAKNLKLVVKRLRADKNRVEINEKIKIKFRNDFLRLFCVNDDIDGGERKAIVNSDEHYFHFLTFPLLATKDYSITAARFAEAAMFQEIPAVLSDALVRLAEAFRELSAANGLPSTRRIDTIALRMIGVEILHHEMKKLNPNVLLLEAVSLVMDSFLAVREKIAAK